MMSELRFLNDILENIEREIPEVMVTLHKRHSNVNFLKVESRVLDPQLLYIVNSFVIITYNDMQDVLDISLLSYKCEVLSRSTLRFYDTDEEKGLPTYILLLLKLFRETLNGLCSGIKAEEIFAHFDKVTKDDLVRCLIERCPDSGGTVFRSLKCREVYSIQQLEEANGICVQCEELFTSMFGSEETLKEAKNQEEPLRCPFPACGRSFRRPVSYRKHLRKHPAGGKDEVDEAHPDEDHPAVDVEDDPAIAEEDDGYDETVLLVCETSINGSTSDTEKGKREESHGREEHFENMDNHSDVPAPTVKRRKRRKLHSGKGKPAEARQSRKGEPAEARKKKKTRLETICDKIQGDLTCEQCSISFSEKIEFVKHMKTIHPAQIRCDQCSKSFSLKEELADHEEKYHQRLSCDECGVLCLNQNSLNSHRSVVHRSTLEPCYVCGKWMKKPSILAHIRLVHQADEQRNHLCNICGNKYKTKTDLDRHYTKHTGQKKYYCSVCGKGYRFWGGADDCQRKHDQNLRYVCREDGCGKGFNSRFRLDQHTRTHSGVRPFQCPLCSYDCTRKDNLRKHIRGTHKYTVNQMIELEKTASGFKKSQENSSMGAEITSF